MSERDDPAALAARLETEADRLQRQSQRLQGEVDAAREDWQRKREDASVPGAPTPEHDDTAEAQARGSPAPEAPPEGAAPGKAQTPTEGSVGPPADQIDSGS